MSGPDGTDSLTNIEYLQFDDATIRLRPGTGAVVNFDNLERGTMDGLRDFDGNQLTFGVDWHYIARST